MHILVAFDRFQNPLKKHAKKLQQSCLNVATQMNATWPRTWTKRDRNLTTNPTQRDHKRVYEHGQTAYWPRCNVAREPVHVVGHVPDTFNIAKRWPAIIFVQMKRGQKFAMNVASNVRWTWPEFYWSRYFFRIFLCFSADTSRKLCSQKCTLFKSRYYSRITFFINFFQNGKRQNGTWKTCLGPQTG